MVHQAVKHPCSLGIPCTLGGQLQPHYGWAIEAEGTSAGASCENPMGHCTTDENGAFFYLECQQLDELLWVSSERGWISLPQWVPSLPKVGGSQSRDWQFCLKNVFQLVSLSCKLRPSCSWSEMFLNGHFWGLIGPASSRHDGFGKKREGRRKEKATFSWISSFPFGFQAPESLPNKMSTFFPLFINLWCLLYSQFQCSQGTWEAQITGLLLRAYAQLEPQSRKEGGKRLLAQSCLFSALHV